MGSIKLIFIFPTFNEGDKDKSNLSLLQPLEKILANCPVIIPKGSHDNAIEIDESIAALNVLIDELTKIDSISASCGIAPGFETRGHKGRWIHHVNRFNGQYETLVDVNTPATHSSSLVPVPSPSTALKYYIAIKKTWEERKNWAAGDAEKRSQVCSCIGRWDHSQKQVLPILANQVMEQVRITKTMKSCGENEIHF